MATKVRITSKELGTLVDGMGRRARTAEYKKALKKMLPKLRHLSVKAFATESEPSGMKWQRLAPSTLIEKMRLGFGSKKILVRTGRLRSSVTRVNHPDNIAKFRTFKSKTTLFWGTRTPYGVYHQSGEPRTKLPRRRFLPKAGDKTFNLLVAPAMEALITSLKRRWI